MSTGEFGSDYYESQFESVDREIVRLAIASGVDIVEPGVIERVIRADPSITTHANAVALRKLRGLLEVHYELAIESVDSVGSEESRRILAHVRERLARHFDPRSG